MAVLNHPERISLLSGGGRANVLRGGSHQLRLVNRIPSSVVDATSGSVFGIVVAIVVTFARCDDLNLERRVGLGRRAGGRSLGTVVTDALNGRATL